MGSRSKLLDLYLESTTDEILALLDRDNDTRFLTEEWRDILMEEVCNRYMPKFMDKKEKGNNLIDKLPKIKIKINLGRKR